MSPFDFVNQIIQGKKNLLIDENLEKEYLPFIVNRALSYHTDCIFYANEMNRYPTIDKKMQNDFLLNTIRSRKRPFIKWAKSVENDDIEAIKIFYGYSNQKAMEILSLLSEEQIQTIKTKIDRGGK